MSGAMLAVLLARMLITAAIVVSASLVAERSGSLLGAMVATLPLSAGPAYVFLALDHDAAFVAASAVTSLLGVGATSAFVVGHALAARARTAVSLASAVAAWALYLFVASRFSWGIGGAAVLALATTLAGYGATGASRRAAMPAIPRRLWHLAVRACAVMALVAAVTLIGRALGPAAAGYAALVPVVFSSFVLILQPRIGGAPVAAIMSHGLVGMVGYAPALTLLNLCAEPLGSGTALGVALATAVGWNAGVVLVRRLRRG